MLTHADGGRYVDSCQDDYENAVNEKRAEFERLRKSYNALLKAHTYADVC
jgi:hypothetical protein